MLLPFKGPKKGREVNNWTEAERWCHRRERGWLICTVPNCCPKVPASNPAGPQLTADCQFLGRLPSQMVLRHSFPLWGATEEGNYGRKFQVHQKKRDTNWTKKEARTKPHFTLSSDLKELFRMFGLSRNQVQILISPPIQNCTYPVASWVRIRGPSRSTWWTNQR